MPFIKNVIKISALVTTVLSVVLVCAFFRTNSEIIRDLSSIPTGATIPLSNIQSIPPADYLCILGPYSISYKDPDASIKYIFGDINTTQWNDDIIDRHQDEHWWSFYIVNDNRITDFLDIPRRIGRRYMKADNGASRQCFDPSEICLTAKGAEEGEEYLTLTICEKK